MADIGGGALYDIGCYPIVTARFIFGAEPMRVMAMIDRDPEFRHRPHHQRRRSISARAAISPSPSRPRPSPYQRVNILGTKARLEVEIPFNAPQGGAMKL